MSLPQINPGLLFCSGTGAANGAFLYPDPTGLDTTPPANTWFLSDNSTLNIFGITDRDALIHRIWVDSTGGTNYPRIWIGPKAGSTVTIDLMAAQTSGNTYVYGPGGILMPGGFKVYLPPNASTLNFTIAYEVI